MCEELRVTRKTKSPQSPPLDLHECPGFKVQGFGLIGLRVSGLGFSVEFLGFGLRACRVLGVGAPPILGDALQNQKVCGNPAACIQAKVTARRFRVSGAVRPGSCDVFGVFFFFFLGGGGGGVAFTQRAPG